MAVASPREIGCTHTAQEISERPTRAAFICCSTAAYKLAWPQVVVPSSLTCHFVPPEAALQPMCISPTFRCNEVAH
eukprot:2127684-Karenia_brevis.AAC.1